MLYPRYEQHGNRRRKYRKHQRGRKRYSNWCMNNGACRYCRSNKLIQRLKAFANAKEKETVSEGFSVLLGFNLDSAFSNGSTDL